MKVVKAGQLKACVYGKTAELIVEVRLEMTLPSRPDSDETASC